MSKWYVCIDHLSDEQLEVFGWYRGLEGSKFSIYSRAYGEEEQIVRNNPPRFLFIDDYNDAQLMKANILIHAPPDGEHE